MAVELFEDENRAIVQVAEDQQSLAIGRGGQNVRLAARLTGWKIDIRSAGGTETPAEEKTTKEELAVETVAETDTLLRNNLKAKSLRIPRAQKIATSQVRQLKRRRNNQ